MTKQKSFICPHCGETIEITPALYTQIMRQGGANGGKATKKKYGADYYKELGRKAAAKRWENHIKPPEVPKRKLKRSQ